ncbi:MAG: MFS transporter, partial [Planctomycetaceae bacterium]|nr:MFS transporter [Planctomycetaceae bacterium]
LFTLTGLVIISMAPSYGWLVFGAMMLGTGSSVFHPESSRMARMASGGRFGLAQSIFQVGGNAGSSVGPLLAAAFIIPYGQRSLSWFIFFPLSAILVLLPVSRWASRRIRRPRASARVSTASSVSRKVVIRTLIVLLILIFSKYFYLASISSYFIFYLTGKFGISVEAAQTRLFIFLFAMALGTLLGGPIGDRIGRKYVIWVSILGVAPFTMAMPHLNLMWTGIFVFIIGFVLASAFAAIVVFAQELLPGRVGLVAGLFFGLSFGIAGVGAAVLGKLADLYSVDFVYAVCAYLPLLGCVAIFLPNLKENRKVV